MIYSIRDVNCVFIIFDIAMATIEFHAGLTKNHFSWDYSVLQFFAEITEISEFHMCSGLTLREFPIFLDLFK